MKNYIRNKDKEGGQMENLILINKMLPDDWEQVREIYLEGIATGNATYQKEAPSWETWDNGHILECRIVARLDGKVLGWAALSPVSSRCVYSGVAEVSIYVSQSSKGKGIGSKLLKTLIEISEQNGYWTLQSGIFPENVSSLKLHIKSGFRKVGRRERIGKMDGAWRDTILLERRSNIVGIN
jgi:L-amino acid N-acyltransferase YncA